ncbi:MAG: ubiquitin-like small modifier protein 1 [Halanaeroarchaeum sp.]
MQWKLFADLAEVAGSKTIEVSVDPGTDATVGDALDSLVADRPALRDRITDDDGDLVDHVNVLRNGQNVFAAAEGLDTAVEAEDELALFPPVSGGSAPGTAR